MRKGFDESVARRRIQLLLDEAKCNNPCPDQTIKMAMRVISNFFSCGGDVSSSEAKEKCCRISKEALRIRQSDPDWKKKTINEHQEPLDDIWQWILRERNSISVEDVANRFRSWPMVVVTSCEDKHLRDELKKRGKQVPCDPIQRYQQAGIKVLAFDNGDWKELGV
jgi:hypothetical protein